MLRDQLQAEYENRFALKQDYAHALKFDPSQPRDDKGRWTNIKHRMATLKIKYPAVAQNYPRSTHTEMGSIEAHTKDVGREWEKQLTDDEMAGISERFGSDVEKLMETAIPLHDIGKAEAIESGAGKAAQHQFTIPIMQDVLRKEGFSDKDITLATELLNHDLIGPLFRGYEGFSALEADVVKKLHEKATRVGMDVADFTTLQMAFYQADASAYPYITSFMTQEPSGKWTFKGNPKITAIEKLMARKFDPSQPRDEHGRWTWGSQDVKLALNVYVGGTARYINEHLRAGKGARWEQQEVVAAMDEHMRKNLLTEDTTLTRTVSNFVVKGLEVGDIYQDNGFVSTTLKPELLSMIRRDIGVNNEALQSTLTIQAPKGLGHINVNMEIGYDHDYSHQKEVILPRGLRYQVVSKEQGKMVVKVLQ